MIPMLDMKQQYQSLKAEIEPKICVALAEAQYILGPNVTAFEQEAADYLGVKHAIGVANGTDALHLALLAAGIGEGDEVITSAFTFIATAEAISYVGANVVFADIDNKTFNLDVERVAAAVTNKTKAILAVHLFGQPADMPQLKALCEQHNIALIEDCAQAFGANIANKQIGSFGLVGCFSFFPSKNLSCYGDGGLIVTDDEQIAQTIKMLRNHGSQQRNQYLRIGYNSRLDEIQAVILRVKLKYINHYNQQRRRIAQGYSNGLEDTDIITPYEDKIGSHIYHQYTLLSSKRHEIAQKLSDNDIASAIYYPIPLHQQPVYQSKYQSLSLPVSQKISKQCLSLPMFPELNNCQVATIVSVIKSVCR